MNTLNFRKVTDIVVGISETIVGEITENEGRYFASIRQGMLIWDGISPTENLPVALEIVNVIHGVNDTWEEGYIVVITSKWLEWELDSSVILALDTTLFPPFIAWETAQIGMPVDPYLAVTTWDNVYDSFVNIGNIPDQYHTDIEGYRPISEDQ